MSESDTEPKPSRRLWIFAAVAALALHLGGAALAIAHLRNDDPDDSLGTSAMAIDLDMTSPRVEVSDLPPGPDADASVASPAIAEQQAVVKETDLPKAIPTETENPDRVVTQIDTKKPKEDDPKIAAVQTSASTESVAAEATAMPSSDTVPEGPRSVAPVLGTGESVQRLRATWQKELIAHLEKHKRNPVLEKFRNTRVLVNLTLDRLGHVTSSSIAESSGDPAYDAAALDMIHRSDPVPPPPPRIADEGLSYTLPVVFRVKGKG